METIVKFIDRHLELANKYTDYASIYFDQAFGALMFYCENNLKDEPALQELWETTYRPKFETIVYGEEL